MTTTNDTKDVLKIQETSENIEFSETTFFCKICKKHLEKSNFHSINIIIEDIILYQEYYKYICMNCSPKEAIYWNNTQRELEINQKILNEHFFRNSKIKFEKEHSISIDNLIQRPKAMEFLGITDKNWIKERVSMGILKEYTFIFGPGDFNTKKGKGIPIIQKYYEPTQLELLKYIKDNGFLTLRTKPSIKKGTIFTDNPPYLIRGSKNRQYLLTNINEQKRVCSTCLQYKSFDKFNKNKNLECNIALSCLICGQKVAKERYKNFTPNEKREHLNNIRKWMSENHDKVKLYRKVFNGKFENKLKRNIRNRVASILRSVKDNYYYNIYMKDPSFEVSLSDFGCSKKELIIYLESKFLDGMTGQNYGPGYGLNQDGKLILDENGNTKKLKQWQVDHIKPVSSFNLNDPEEIKKINHYTNLLPMWADDNNEKSNKTELCPILDKEFLEKYKELEVLIKKKDNNTNEPIRHESMLEMQDRKEFIEF
ncbi:MAG: hypothetical protein Q7R95_11490 [bacterium]|nr:hypothetical protein [bacterium]